MGNYKAKVWPLSLLLSITPAIWSGNWSRTFSCFFFKGVNYSKFVFIPTLKPFAWKRGIGGRREQDGIGSSWYLPAGQDLNELQAALKLSVAGPVEDQQKSGEYLSFSDNLPSQMQDPGMNYSYTNLQHYPDLKWNCAISVQNSVLFSSKSHAWFLGCFGVGFRVFFGQLGFLCLCILG